MTQTRYVPVPVAVPQHTFASQANNRPSEHRGDDRHDHPQANNTPPATHQPSGNTAGNDQHRGGNNNGNADRDHDGKPDRRS